MKHVKDMVADANSIVNTITAEKAIELHSDPSVLFVDLRDIRELQREGFIPNSFHCPRGMLEFWIDPESPYAKEQFQSDQQYIFYCASGWRSALSARTAQEMGLKRVSHIETGFSGWKQNNGPVENKFSSKS